MATPCGHCGFRGPIEHKQDVIVWVEEDRIAGYGPIIWNHTVRIWWCPACQEPTLHTSIWSPDIEEAGTDQRVYPPGRDNTPLPEIVRTRLDAAMKVKKIEPAFYAVGIGRMLEAVCKDQAASGKDLFEKLDDLVAKDRLPKPLAEAAHELRKLRNLGAHDKEVEVGPEDVALIEALADAILEYLYRAPAAVAAVRAGLDERRSAANTGTR